MNQTSINPLVIVGIILIGVIAYAALQEPTPPPPAPGPRGPDLREAFRTNNDRAQAKLHATQMATILRSLARMIDYDANRRDSLTGRVLAPRLVNGVQVDDLRMHLRDLRMNGWSFAQQYPGLGPAIHQHLKQAVGTDGDAIDETKRRAWITALDELANSCDQAAQ